MPYQKNGQPFLYDDVTNDIVGVKDPDGSEHLFISDSLQAWAYGQIFRIASATRNSDGAITSASIVWPDGTPGTFSGTPSSAAPGALDAWTATYGAKVVAQPTVSRDIDGNVIAQPAIAIT